MKKKIKYIIGIFILLALTLLCYIYINNNVNNINNSIVYIKSIDKELINSGSGFVYKIEKNKVYIVTCYHVIENYNDIYVYNNNKKKEKATVLNYDEYTDIAILTIENKLKLKEINIGNSADIKNNDKISTIGTPLNINNINTKANGFIEEKNKNIIISTTHGKSKLDAIELNLSVEGGNSGGPLLDKNNNVIGMMFLKDENFNNKSYAQPINNVMEIVKQLENNNLKRPNLGAIMCNTTNKDLLNKYEIVINLDKGVVLLELDTNGVLRNHGLKNGDIITKLNNKEITDVTYLRQILYEQKVGDNINLEYYRDGFYYSIDIEL